MSDGMDITLVELDMERSVLWYSGAQNSLLFVRDGECQRIKGDRCSIGDAAGELPAGFLTHRIDLRPGDRVYLYSDGFIHQFGGADGRKKFSNAQLMKTVAALCEHSAQETGTQLATMHQAWQGQQPQTDDIVLIGFSIAQQAAVMAA
jgi:serine phosphatase RsbU (regulator of sigma subunit)